MSYILPKSTAGLPGQLSLGQFIQTVLAGVTGLSGTLVRPQWQPAPPKNPDGNVNWLAFGVTSSDPDANSFIGVNSAGETVTQRHETLEVPCTIYGPDSMETAGLIRDGLQLPPNLYALRSANMGFVEVSRTLHVPDLINERWVNRVQMSVFFRREIQHVYPILTLLSATGTIHTVVGNEQYLLDWSTQN